MRLRQILGIALVVSVAGCGAPVPNPTSAPFAMPTPVEAQSPTAPAPSPIATAAPLPSTPPVASRCRANDLAATASSQGETGVVHIDVFVTNVGPHACTLSGAPVNVSLLRRDGSALSTDLLAPEPTTYQGVVLAPLARNAADLIVYWTNWCGAAPGPLAIRISLAGDAGTISASRQGPLVARCDVPGRDSTLQTEGFLPGGS